MHLINVACDDPGATIGAQLALPLLQERLDGKGREYADRRASEAELLIVQMEVMPHHPAPQLRLADLSSHRSLAARVDQRLQLSLMHWSEVSVFCACGLREVH